jgi:hypothetical protein
MALMNWRREIRGMNWDAVIHGTSWGGVTHGMNFLGGNTMVGEKFNGSRSRGGRRIGTKVTSFHASKQPTGINIVT